MTFAASINAVLLTNSLYEAYASSLAACFNLSSSSSLTRMLIEYVLLLFIANTSPQIISYTWNICHTYIHHNCKKYGPARTGPYSQLSVTSHYLGVNWVYFRYFNTLQHLILRYFLSSSSSSSGRALALFLTLTNPCKPLFFGHLSLLHSFILFANLLPKSSQKVVFPLKK